MEEIQILMDQYVAWLRSKTTLRQVDDWIEVTTPYLDRNNDYLQIYARRQNGSYILTDDGHILEELELSGCKLESPKRMALLQMTLNGFGVKLVDGALEIRAAREDFPLRKHNLVQAILAVNDLFYLAAPVVASVFLEDVKSWMELSGVRFLPNVKFSGASGYDHLFDFAIPAFNSAPERIIRAINAVAAKINDDPRIQDKIKIAFLPNYSVSLAEKIIPATDVSQQISTAGKEASGTGNMKLALNGAVTIGTLDGANVEILEEVGSDNIFIFGNTVQQIDELRRSGYDARLIYQRNPELKAVLDWLHSDVFAPAGELSPVFDSILVHGDPFFVAADYEAYCQTQDEVDKAYRDKARWARMAITKLDARPAPSGALPVVIKQGSGGVLFHEACGHGLEADIIAKGGSVYRGKKGELVASPLVTLVDDGTMRGEWGAIAYDDEGHASQYNVLIENGVLTEYMWDYLRARNDGRPQSGNGRRQSYQHLPMVRMTNTYVLNGTEEPDDIVRATDYGVYVAKLGGGSVNTASGDFVFGMTEAYLIENGEITAPLREGNLIGNGPQVLLDIDLPGNDFAMGHPGPCGKDGPGVPVGDGQPPVRVKSRTHRGRAA